MNTLGIARGLGQRPRGMVPLFSLAIVKLLLLLGLLTFAWFS